MLGRISRIGLAEAPRSWRWTKEEKNRAIEAYLEMPPEAQNLYYTHQLVAQEHATAAVTVKLRTAASFLPIIAGFLVGFVVGSL